jgi:hypothetical protein
VITHVIPPGEEGMHLLERFCECMPVPDQDTYYHNELRGLTNDMFP